MADDPVRRDEAGKFLPGNKGGPGRPAKKKVPFFTMSDLNELANLTGPDMWFVARLHSDREEWLEDIRKFFPPKTVEKIENLARLSDLATTAMVNRMISEYSS
jgi:hypothetical protein